MLESAYHIDSSPDFLKFEFKSIGPLGLKTKVVKYEEFEATGTYNLDFGDKIVGTEFLDDLSVSDNGDMQKVLNTVARTLYLFSDHYPEAIIFATGSTESRTRLYRMAISSKFSIIESDFEVLGLTDSNWEFLRNNIDYHAFSVRRKS